MTASARRNAAVTPTAGAVARPRGARRYIALLRAINVGTHQVRMEQLRALFEELGFSDVATFIASGNVIFDAAAADERKLAEKIEQHLQQQLGYEVATFLRTPAELAAVAGFDAFPAATRAGDPFTLYIAFLKQPPAAAAVRKLQSFSNDVDEFVVHGREAYWLARKNLRESTFTGARLEKVIGAATLRNVTTVRRLASKYPPGDAVAAG